MDSTTKTGRSIDSPLMGGRTSTSTATRTTPGPTGTVTIGRDWVLEKATADTDLQASLDAFGPEVMDYLRGTGPHAAKLVRGVMQHTDDAGSWPTMGDLTFILPANAAPLEVEVPNPDPAIFAGTAPLEVADTIKNAVRHVIEKGNYFVQAARASK